MNLTLDEMMVEEMAKGLSYMDEKDIEKWSYEDAKDWIHDYVLYKKSIGQTPLPFDVDDVYDTIKAMIKTL